MITGSEVHNFVLVARQLALVTSSQRKAFQCEADHFGIYIKNSTGKSRKISRPELDEFCKELSRTGERSASHYQAQTFNASYLLAIVDAFLGSQAGADGKKSV